MYEAIKAQVLETLKEAEVNTIEDAYETLYRLTSRLSDMDDFSNSLLKSIQDKISKGATFKEAFASTIDSEYEFANFDYFSEAFEKYQADLELEFKKAIESKQPARSWDASITWMFDHAVIDVDGTDYTLKQLQNEIESKGDEY